MFNVKEEITNCFEYSLSHSTTPLVYNGSPTNVTELLNLYEKNVIDKLRALDKERKDTIKTSVYHLCKKIFNYDKDCGIIFNNNELFVYNNLIEIFSSLHVPLTEIVQFINACTIGIIDYEQILLSKHACLHDFVPTQYRKIYNKIIDELFVLKPPSSGAGSIGCGEFALAILCENVFKKKEKGDVSYKSLDIEVKTCKFPDKGGRINCQGIIHGADSQLDNYEYLLLSFAEKHKLNYSLNERDEYYITNTSVTKRIKYSNFGKTFIQHFNYWLKNKNVPKSELITLMTEILFLPLTDKGRGCVKTQFYNNIFNSNNCIDFLKLKKAFAKNLFLIQKQMDNIDMMLILNTKTANFVLINNEDDFDSLMDTYVTTNATLVDFGDANTRSGIQFGTR